MNKKMTVNIKALCSLALISQCLILSGTAYAQTSNIAAAKAAPALPAAMQATVERISADSMRGHLSFLASDLLEGRDTPSRGLDLAAEYIAAQFRAIGLEPAGGDGYFQNADWNILKKEIRRRPGAPVPPPEAEPTSPTIVRDRKSVV